MLECAATKLVYNAMGKHNMNAQHAKVQDF